ncbi:hypothetical protein [Nonomuraea roseola]|uniref:Uncharacterized protein n=1 Tax=Nonomuraea roseola TaxID=46179 RepID=A0ABV5PRZ1_9ACTN
MIGNTGARSARRPSAPASLSTFSLPLKGSESTSTAPLDGGWSVVRLRGVQLGLEFLTFHLTAVTGDVVGGAGISGGHAGFAGPGDVRS